MTDKTLIITGNIASSKAYNKLANTTDIPTVKKVSAADIQRINELMVGINQHPKTTQKCDRTWLAAQLGIRATELNNCLKVDVPYGSGSNAVKRSITVLQNRLTKLNTV